MPLPFVVTLSVTFITWVLTALLSQNLGNSATQSASVWLSTGITFGALLALRPARRGAVLAGAGAAAFVLSIFNGQALLPALGFGLNEVLSASAGAWVAGRFRQTNPATGLMDAGKAYAGLLLGAVLTSAMGASMAIVLWSWSVTHPVSLQTEWRVWSSTSFVGILLMAPLVLSFAGFRVKRSGGMGSGQFWAGGATLLLFFVVAALIFSNDVSERFGASLGPTLTYLPLPFIVVTAILWKERGATLATLAAALALVVWTGRGGGPFAEIEAFAGEAVIEVQGYVAVMALLVGVVNALGATAAQALAQAQDWRTRHRLVLASSRTVVASLDATNGLIHWGEGASELLHTNTAALLTVNDLMAHADAQDKPQLLADWLALTQGQREQALWKNTLRWSDGRAVKLLARLSVVRGADGQVEQIAALFEVEA